MPEQSTFHESWHRVADLKPRLRASIHISRQYFRGRLWHVIQDQANNAFARLNTAGYALVGLLDGSRTVRAAWNICNTKLGDDAPTQGEVIELLGQLASNNLLESGSTPDAQAMFERFKRRRTRDMQGRLMNLLFPRLPLFDPDALLERGLFLVGWIFDWPGMILWTMLIGTAVYTLLNAGPTAGKLLTDSSGLLRPDNWLLLLLAFIVDKSFHESGHAIACKKFGKRFGTGGEVHVIGIMLLIFTPVPYVDASSAWLLPDKWRRAIVGAAGMWMEFALAAVAAMIWRYSNPGSTLHAFCYNLMFIASVATVFFNGNPFLRYDGYYILADLLEIPNLLGRAMQYATYLARRYLFGIKQAINPSETSGQRRWLLVYLALSGVVRVLVCTGIILFLVANLRQYPQLTLLLLTMATIAAATWLLVPLGRGAWYLLSSPELPHRRGQAIAISLAIVAVLAISVGILPLPHHSRVEGVVRTEHQRGVFAQSGGLLTWYAPSKRNHTVPAGEKLMQLSNPVLQTSLTEAQARLAAVRIKRRKALAANPAMAQILSHQIAALRQEILRLTNRIDNLTICAPVGGVWIGHHLRLRMGGYIQRGQRIGTMADMGRPLVYAPASQGEAGRIIRYGFKHIQMRLPGKPSPMIPAKMIRVYPGGGKTLPSAALSYLAGGPFAPSLHAKTPDSSAQPFFMLVFQPERNIRLLPGQRIVAQVRLPDQSLLMDIINDLRRTLQPGTGL